MTDADRIPGSFAATSLSTVQPYLRRRRVRLAALGTVAAIAVWLVATVVFPHHTTNHDEAVYLQQAAMLLDGQLFLDPPVDGPFRPWFFVESDAGLYPKYTPPTAAVFAVGKLLGGYRIALALVAGGCVVLTQVTVAEAFDQRTGWVAAGLLLASPLFLIQSAVFLPYVPALLWCLAFAAAYLRADRTGSQRVAAVAGLAIGLAFFARPYTSVLFAAPFIAHALWKFRDPSRATVLRQALTATGGLLGVAIALGYNAYVTGDPLLFPYEAFAPHDGLGFGRREIVGHSLVYTPELAVRATGESLWLFATRWIVGGVLGTLAAVVGFAVAVHRGIDARRAVIAGVGPSVTIGYAYFWGPLNALGELGNPADGLAAALGPYYHVGLLLPVAAFAAVGLLAVGRWLRSIATDRFADPDARRIALVATVVAATVFAGTGVAVAGPPLADSKAASDRLDAAYHPLDEGSFDDSVVFLPTPYGNWLNHPFQKLRNDPGYDDGPVYAMDDRQFDVIDAFPDRTYYRYTYRGIWGPTAGDPVEPRVQEVRTNQGAKVTHAISLGVPTHAESVSMRLASENDEGYAAIPVDESDDVQTTLDVDGESVSVTADGTTATVPIDDSESVELRAFVDYGTGAGYEYRIELPIDTAGDTDTVRTLTPYAEVCDDAFTCDGEAAYVPGAHPDHVTVDHEVTVDA